MSTAPDAPLHEVSFSDSDFRRVRHLMRRLTGISLNPAHRERVYRRLVRRLHALDFPAFDDYLRLLDDARGRRERAHFVNALTTNFTGFFREPAHFDFFSATVLGQLLQRDPASREMRFWSAGCSTGEEAYSLAQLTAGVLREHPQWKATILATDLDSRAIATACRGEYPPDSIPGMPEGQRCGLFAPVQGAGRALLRVRRSVRELVRFQHLNLLHNWPVTENFDAIFCRNVMLYFDGPTRCRLLERFAGQLEAGGYLFIGSTESLRGLSGRFERVDRGIYRKTP